MRVPDLLNHPPTTFAVDRSDQWTSIIGVVGDARNAGLDHANLRSLPGRPDGARKRRAASGCQCQSRSPINFPLFQSVRPRSFVAIIQALIPCLGQSEIAVSEYGQRPGWADRRSQAQQRQNRVSQFRTVVPFWKRLGSRPPQPRSFRCMCLACQLAHGNRRTFMADTLNFFSSMPARYAMKELERPCEPRANNLIPGFA